MRSTWTAVPARPTAISRASVSGVAMRVRARDLGVGELSARQGLGQGRQRPEGAGHPDVLAGGARGESDSPREPGGTGAEARVPATTSVELPDEGKQAGGRRLEVGGELSDLVTETIQLRGALRRGL